MTSVLQWLVRVWQRPAENLPKRISTPNIIELVNKYPVSVDWLLYDDLKGLCRMTYARKALAQQPPEPAA